MRIAGCWDYFINIPQFLNQQFPRMFETSTQIRVRYAETDQMNVVYHGNYAQYFETARAEAIRELGFTYKDMEALGTYMPIVELQCKFLRPAHYDDLLTVKVILKELPPDHRIEFYHEVFNDAGKLLTTGVLYYISWMQKPAARPPCRHRCTKSWRRSLAERSKWAKRSSSAAIVIPHPNRYKTL